jgi:hypothetical protein
MVESWNEPYWHECWCSYCDRASDVNEIHLLVKIPNWISDCVAGCRKELVQEREGKKREGRRGKKREEEKIAVVRRRRRRVFKTKQTTTNAPDVLPTDAWQTVLSSNL